MELPDNSHYSKHLPDIQPSSPKHEIYIEEVGITNVVIPVSFKGKDGSEQHTTADLRLFIDLPKQVKGIHMSRLTEGLYHHLEHNKLFGANELQKLAENILNHAGKESAIWASIFSSLVFDCLSVL